MKKFLGGILVLMMIALAACTAAPTVAAQAITQPAANGTVSTGEVAGLLNTAYDGAASIVTQLAVGTLNLDGTDNAVTKDEAAALLALWENLESLAPQNMRRLGSGTPGPNGTAEATPAAPANPSGADDYQAKLAALTAQIEAAMTSAQLNAIAAMQITQDSAATILQVKGISTEEGLPTNVQRPAGDQSGNGQSANAQAPSGTEQTTPAAGAVNTVRIRLQPGVLNSIIQYLAGVAGVPAPTAQAPFITSGTPDASAGNAPLNDSTPAQP